MLKGQTLQGYSKFGETSFLHSCGALEPESKPGIMFKKRAQNYKLSTYLTGQLDQGGLQGCDSHQTVTSKNQGDWGGEDKKTECVIR